MRLVGIVGFLYLSFASAASAMPVTFGLCEDYPEKTRTLEDVRRDARFLKDIGARVIHVGFNWDEIEPEKDQYHWDFWDEYVRIVSREHGIRILPFVGYTPECPFSSFPGFMTLREGP